MNLQKYKLIISGMVCSLLLLFGPRAIAQIADDFGDGNFTENPVWVGDVSQFVISPDFMLQSNADSLSGSSNSIYLCTEGLLLNNTQWEFFVNPRLATSSNNLMDVYLMSDSLRLKGSLHGYFVRIGGTPDEVALFRKDGLTEVRIIEGETGAIKSSSNNPIRVKVVRKVSGEWLLYADYKGTGTDYKKIGSVNDLTYSRAYFTGLVVRYSNSNRRKFFFDDLYIGPEITDTVPPRLMDVNVISNHELELVYSENIDPATAMNTENFMVDHGIGEPVSATRNSVKFNVVNLLFGLPFPEGQILNLNSSGVKDIAGNLQKPALSYFVYYKARPNDIQINEIMADPDPSVLLPNVEFIELYNHSQFPVNLNAWSIRAGTNSKVLPAVKILPDSFLILTSLTGEALFKDSIAVTAVQGMPTLTNSGATISLLDATGTVISTVSYTDAWYNNTTKKDGGWSLEQKSPFMPCAGKTNWSASLSPAGGTPGRRNSIFSQEKDEVIPAISRVSVISSDTISVFFTEPVMEAQIADPEVFTITQGQGHPKWSGPVAPDFSSAKLALSQPLQVGLLYEISLSGTVQDCAGNSVDENSRARFAIPSVCLPNDVVINEILSDPKTGGTDYIEIYNRSQKIIDLGSLSLGSRDLQSGELKDSKPIAPTGYLCFPGQYVLLTTSFSGVSDFYFIPADASCIEMSSMAAYNNESGVVTLSRLTDHTEIDQVAYNTNMHFAFLNSLDGVSLERVNYNRSSLDITNWNSAASTVGYGTPGYKNSQYSPLIEPVQAELFIEPEVFSPDNDGYQDVVNIAYSFQSPGYTGSITIYDANGRLIKYLARNMLLGSEGQFSWNGLDESQSKARIGIYIAYLEAFTLEGKTVVIKKPFVLGGKL